MASTATVVTVPNQSSNPKPEPPFFLITIDTAGDNLW